MMLRKVPRRRRRGGFVPFRERNPVVIGAVGLGVIAAMLLLAFNIDDIPLLAGRSHSAALSEAGGLKAGDDVRVAGVKVGKVTARSEEHTSELQSQSNLVCRLLLEKKK